MVDNVYRAKIAVYCPQCDEICDYIIIVNNFYSEHYLHECTRCGFKFGIPGKAQCFRGRLELNTDKEIIIKKIVDKIDYDAIQTRLNNEDKQSRGNIITLLWHLRNTIDPSTTKPIIEYISWLEKLVK